MSRSKTDTSLEKYSKADLIWIIKAMQAHMLWPDLDRILADLEYKKEKDRLDQAQKLSQTACDLTRIKQADQKWRKLMGIGGTDG